MPWTAKKMNENTRSNGPGGAPSELEDEGQPCVMRLRQRTRYDIRNDAPDRRFCTGIENYSRYFDGRKPGDAPYSSGLLFPRDFLMFIDESHVTVPQIRAMYNGDRARKKAWSIMASLPSAYDNRPLVLTSSAPGRTTEFAQRHPAA